MCITNNCRTHLVKLIYYLMLIHLVNDIMKLSYSMVNEVQYFKVATRLHMPVMYSFETIKELNNQEQACHMMLTTLVAYVCLYLSLIHI